MFAIDSCIFHENVSVYTFKVYAYLWALVDKNFQFKGSNIQFVKILNISKHRLIKSLRELEEKELIKITPRYNEDGGRNTNLITILPKNIEGIVNLKINKKNHIINLLPKKPT